MNLIIRPWKSLSFFLSFFSSLSLYCHLQESSCAKGPWKYCSFYFIISGASMHVLFNLKIAQILPRTPGLPNVDKIRKYHLPTLSTSSFKGLWLLFGTKNIQRGVSGVCLVLCENRAPGSTAYCNHTCLFLNITKETDWLNDWSADWQTIYLTNKPTNQLNEQINSVAQSVNEQNTS